MKFEQTQKHFNWNSLISKKWNAILCCCVVLCLCCCLKSGWISHLLRSKWEIHPDFKIYGWSSKQGSTKWTWVHNHPVEAARPNVHFALNSTGFGCTIRYSFWITPESYRVFPWEVLQMAIHIVDHFLRQWNFPNTSSSLHFCTFRWGDFFS